MDTVAPHLQLGPISASAGAPLWQQVVESFRREASAGRLAADAPLPSVRALAEQLVVSVITVKRAYDELERDGLLYSRQGLGTFVAADAEPRARALHRRDAQTAVAAAVAAARAAGMADAELLNVLQRELEGNDDARP